LNPLLLIRKQNWSFKLKPSKSRLQLAMSKISDKHRLESNSHIAFARCVLKRFLLTIVHMKAYKMVHSKALELQSTSFCLNLSTKDREIKNNTKTRWKKRMHWNYLSYQKRRAQRNSWKFAFWYFDNGIVQ
jgi:hypothetical protein